MNAVGQFLLGAWDWNRPVVLLACATAGVAYAAGCGRRGRWGFFVAAIALVLATLLSPLNTLATGVLFSAHMAQHLALLLIAPALVVLSLPEEFRGPASRMETRRPQSNLMGYFRGGPSRRGGGGESNPLGYFAKGWRVLGWMQRGEVRRRRAGGGAWRAVAGWGAGVGAMWFWHAPGLCDAAAQSAGMHAVQTVSLLAMGTAFWWPILGPQRAARLPPMFGIGYLATACFACTALGILLTLTPINVCPIFQAPVSGPAVWARLREAVGAERDRQIGGLMMWLPMCVVYLSAILWELGRWFGVSGALEEKHP
jgi:cytochrome c oxidase assembly factor CtaG